MTYFKSFFLLIFGFSVLLSEQNVKLILHSNETIIGKISEDNVNSNDYYIINSESLGVIQISKDLVKIIDKVKSSGISPNKAIIQSPSEVLINSRSLNENQGKGPEKNSTSFDRLSLSKNLYEKVKSLDAPKSWSGNLRMGMNYAFGDRNYTQTYMRGKVKIQNNNSPHIFLISGEYNYRETEHSSGLNYVSADRYTSEFTYRWLFSEHWFMQNLTNLRVDNIKGIDKEMQNLTGLGYRSNFLKNLEMLAGVSIGFKDRNLSLEPPKQYFIVNIFQEINWNPSKKIKFQQKVNFFQNPNNLDIYNFDLIFSFNYRFTDLLGFEIRYSEDFDNGISDNFNENSRLQNALTLFF